MTGDTPSEVFTRAAERGLRALGFLAEPDHAGLEALALLADQGLLKVHVEKTFALQDAPAAHAHGETGRTTGKIVLVP